MSRGTHLGVVGYGSSFGRPLPHRLPWPARLPRRSPVPVTGRPVSSFRAAWIQGNTSATSVYTSGKPSPQVPDPQLTMPIWRSAAALPPSTMSGPPLSPAQKPE